MDRKDFQSLAQDGRNNGLVQKVPGAPQERIQFP